MASLGRRQWSEAYPVMSNIESDISNEYAYVICDEADVPMVYGAVIFTGEPAYAQIDSWLSNGEYVVVHRLCIADSARGKGLAKKYFDCVCELAGARGVNSFKVDTNYDNEAMLHIMKVCGFTYCGEIVYPQGSRMAFEKLIYSSEIVRPKASSLSEKGELSDR